MSAASDERDSRFLDFERAAEAAPVATEIDLELIPLMECTRTSNRGSWGRVSLRLLTAIAVVFVGCGWSAGPAVADGDPASDVLATQNLFLPADAVRPGNHAAQLSALLASAQRSGYEVRVALIAAPTDLGSITELWRQPQNYAKFLGQELFLVYRGPVLVVMPNGFGLYQGAGSTAAEARVIRDLGLPGAALASAAVAAVQRLAENAGHPLSLAPSGSPAPKAAASETVAWLVFALGVAVVLLAWAASLRARPLRPLGPSAE